MKPVDVANLRAFAKTLEGRTLTTQARGLAFQVSVTRTGLLYTPRSTGTARLQTNNDIERVLERHGQTGSLRPGEYADITVNASYLLAVVAKYTRVEQ